MKSSESSSSRWIRFAVAAWLGIAVHGPVAAAAEVAGCGPFARPPAPESSTAPAASGDAEASANVEVLIVLPRQPDGGIGAEDLRFGAGAEIVESRWSPVLCATVARVAAPAGTDPAELVASLPEGAAAVPNDIYRPAATVTGDAQREIAPAPQPDPYRAMQHGLERAGIDDAAWAASDTRPLVAILDSRPATDHPDLGGVRVLETGRTTARPGVHGTLIAGVIAATRSNGFGISGMLVNADAIAVPVCTPAKAPGLADECRLYDLVLGSDLAWDAGARIFNLSLVGPANPVLERAVERLDRLGAVVVAAAGNEGLEAPRYPAAYPSVVAVGAVDRDGDHWERSNTGLSVEVTAPGVEIVSSVPGGGFAFADGTSLATAHVSALIAMLSAVAPDPHTARRAFFEAGQTHPEATRSAAAFPSACEALARLERPCAPAETP